MGKRGNRLVLFAVSVGLGLVVSVCAAENQQGDAQDGWVPDNVRAVQKKLHDNGLYFGEIDGAYSSELAAALGRYQIRSGLPITGQLDVETSNALGVKPAVTTSSSINQPRTSEAWGRLRKDDTQFPGKTVWRAPSTTANETAVPRSAPADTTIMSSTNSHPASSPPAIVDSRDPASTTPITGASPSASDFSTERLRDYVGAFVLAGLDPNVGSEADFFANRVQYYDEGTKNRERIRADLKRYDSRWPGRKFWLAGDISVDPQGDERVRVTFPLRYELRNGARRLSGKLKKTIVLERAGADLQIVSVNERKMK